MSLVLESTNPSSNLLRFDSTSWPSSPNRHSTLALSSFLASMSSRSLSSFFAHIPASSVPAQELNNVPASTWYSPSILAPGCPGEVCTWSHAARSTTHMWLFRPSTTHMVISFPRIQLLLTRHHLHALFRIQEGLLHQTHNLHLQELRTHQAHVFRLRESLFAQTH